MSVILTTIKNPFEPEINDIQVLNYIKGQSLKFYLNGFDFNQDDIIFVVSVNGGIIEDHSCIIFDDDKIAIVARVDGLVAGAVAKFVAGSIFTTAFSTAVGYSLVYGAVYVATLFAISYGMSYLAGALAPDASDVGRIDQDTQVEATYSWGQLRQTHSENTAIPILFGDNLVAGEVINRFISVVGDKETLNVLMGICDHEIDSITDVKINNQDYTNYHNVTVITDRLGTDSDALIDNFNEVVTQIDVGSKLNNGIPVVQTTSGDSVEKIKVIIHAPRGFYFTNNEGGLDARTATFDIHYRVTGVGSWTLSGNKTMAGTTTEAQREIYTIDGLAADQYDVQITRTNAEETSFKGNSEIYLSAIQEIVEESLIYPGLAKYAVEALATEQLSGGMPNFTCRATRANVQVFNRELETPAWGDQRATNPAWICYYMLVWGAKIDESRLIWDDWYNWAVFCDIDIDGEYGFIINTMIQSGNFWDKVQEIAKLGRATIIRRGTRYGVFVDKATDTISHLFTMGNIIEETFKIQYLPQKDRANAIEIEYTDVDRDYSRQVICVYSNNYLEDEIHGQKATIKMNAAVSKAQVIREGVYRINSNKYLVRVITFEADIDSFACTVGDLFYFQHETVNYEDGIYGSRIIDAGNDDGSGNVYIEYDQDQIIDTSEIHKTIVRLSDDTLVEKTIDSALNGYTNIVPSSDDLSGWTEAQLTAYHNTSETDDPFGGSKAIKLVPNSTVTDHYFYSGSIPTTADDNNNFSMYIKAGEIDRMILQFYSIGPLVWVELDLTQKTIDYTVGSGGLLEPCSNGWFRFSCPTPATSTPGIIIVNAYGNIPEAGNDSDCFYCCFPQLTQFSDDLFPYLVYGKYSASKYALTTSWSTIPEKYDVFLFGETDTYKKTYRLTSISRSDDFIREITAIEYISAIYTENDGYVIEVPTWTTRHIKAIHVTVNEFLSYNQDGSYLSNINISWHRAYTQTGSNWTIWLENTTAGTDPIRIGDAFRTNFAWNNDLIIGDSYIIYVVAMNEGATDTGDNTQTITIQGNAAPPDDVTGFSGSWDSIKRQVSFTWNPITNIDIAYYEIRSGGTWTIPPSSFVTTAPGTSQATSIFIDEGISDSIVYRIKAVDTSGIYSITEDTDTVAIDTADCPLAVPTGLDWSSTSNITSDGRDVVTILATWTDSSGDSDDWQQYDIILEDMTVNKESFYITQNNHYQWEVMPNRSYGIKIRNTDVSGNHTAWTSQVVYTTTKDASAPATPTWPASDYIIAGFKVIGLNWNANSEYDMSHYVVERDLSTAFTGSEVILGEVSATFKSDDQGLSVSTQYYYRIKAVDTSGNESGYSTIVNTTTLQVGATDIAADSIIASKINVSTLSAISANMGTLTTGVLESTNYVATGETTPAGFKLDSTNDTFDMAGFEYDPTNGLQITDPNENASITVGDIVDGDYCQLTAGDLTFYQYLASAHRVTKSLKRIEVGSADNDVVTQLAGYWATQPQITISPKQLTSFDYTYRLVDQALRLSADDIEETSTGSKVYQFTPKAELVLSAGSVSASPGDTDSDADQTAVTASRSLVYAGIRQVSATIKGGGSWTDQYLGVKNYYYATIRARLNYYENGSWHNGTWSSNIVVSPYDFYHTTHSFTCTTGTATSNDITHVTAEVNVVNHTATYVYEFGTFSPITNWWNSFAELDSYVATMPAGSVLAEGTLNYIAISE